MTADPTWWRGGTPTASGRPADASPAISEISLPSLDDGIGLRRLDLVDVRVVGAEFSLTDIRLAVHWAEFEDCRFTQRVKPVLNDHGIAAQGSFAVSPASYRNCRFERVRFKLLGGFKMGRATFENCTFWNCRWEGHFAHDAWLLNNRFIGKMNGCVWFGTGDDGANVITGNDFTQTVFTTNVGFRSDYPVTDQRWPAGYQPLIDDA